MLALALGVLLISAILQVYLSVKSLYNTTQNNSRLQENIRFSAYYLTEKISVAGYAGCGNLANLDLKNNTKYAFSLQNSVIGYSSINLPSNLAGYKIVTNTDVIVIQKADYNTTTLTKDISVKNGETSIYVIKHPASKAGDPLLISDCIAADLFTSANYQGATIKTEDKIVHNYQLNNTQVSKFTEIAYFISSTTSQKEKPRYGLYYALNYGDKEMILDGITAMKIKYGVDTQQQGKVSQYYTADEVAAQNLWSEVLSVIITLSQPTKTGKAQSWDIYIKLRERSV